MKNIYKIRKKWRDLTVYRQSLGVGPAGENNVSLVIYLDYEREFAVEEARHSAEKGFNSILDILSEYNVKATWNCVGLIGQHYPKTINQLIEQDQEISSHTYSHIVPLRTNRYELINDISHVKKFFKKEFNKNIRGFHSPQDAWSKSLLEILEKLNFDYDIAVESNRSKHNACRLSTLKYKLFSLGKGIIRIPSLSDDWRFMSDNLSPDKMLQQWKGALDEFYFGKTIAVGFHPWVIGQDDARIEVFESFVKSVALSQHIKTYTGSEIANWYTTT